MYSALASRCSRFSVGLLIAGVWTCCFVPAAWGTPIVYHISGIASGNLGSTNFANAPFVITAVGDTDKIQVYGSGPGNLFIVNLVTANVNISGLGTTTILFTGLDFALDQSSRVLSFDSSKWGPVYEMLAPAFSSWNAASSFGPVSVGLTNGYLGFLDTSAGEIVWQPDDFVFAAFVTPEPSTFAICSLGFAGLLVLSPRWLKRAHP